MPIFHTATFVSPLGEIALATDSAGALTALTFTDCGSLAAHLGPDAHLVPAPSSCAAVVAELTHYFAGALREFRTAVAPVIGTPFLRRVWSALALIPYGDTWSYARLARETGSSARAVGSANGANPISLVVPCH
ncbi:MAG: methylated-DNA--[protein]-cysteine S-methyltransferase, partial [Verrucomicrobia bacterium]